MKLLLVRHGEADHNNADFNKQVFAGSRIDSDLTINGEEAAKRLADRVCNMGGVDMIFSSCLKRSIKTAQIIKDGLDCDTPIFELRELNEINVGDFTGLGNQEVEDRFPEASKVFYKGEVAQWNFPEGESFDDVKQRLEVALTEIASKKAQRVLIVGHSMLNQILIFILTGKHKVFNSHDEIFEIELGEL